MSQYDNDMTGGVRVVAMVVLSAFVGAVVAGCILFFGSVGGYPAGCENAGAEIVACAEGL